MHRRPILSALERYGERFPNEQDVVMRFRSFVMEEPRCFERDCWKGHVTGSAWLVDSTGTRVLLTHHRKLGRWLQVGGHSDGDAHSLNVALREAAEESGLEVRAASADLFDIDIHPIPQRGNDPAHFHFDARYVVRVVGSEAFVTSEESHELAWVPIAEISRVTTEPSMLRMAVKWLAADTRAPTKAR